MTNLSDRSTRAGPLDPVILADVDRGVQVPVITAPGTLFIPRDFYLEIQRGNILGMKIYTIPGRSDGVSQTALEDITQIPGVTVLPRPGGIQLEIISTSANDDVGGSGVQSVDIHYLDPAGVEQEETCPTNGLVAQLTVKSDFADIQWMHTRAIGTVGGVAAGNISLRGVGGGTVFEYIKAGGNQSLTCRYVVPTATVS